MLVLLYIYRVFHDFRA